MNKTEKQKLETIIKKGKWNYVLKYGVLYWGLGLLFFTEIVNRLFFLDEPTLIFNPTSRADISINIFSIGIFLFVGLMIGLWGWESINERIKNKHLPLKEQIQKQKKLIWKFWGYFFLGLIVFALLSIGLLYWAFS